ncbi:endonuclease/exonuclease/phosphatase family protein [Iamia majanohamensis]|uniref:Endonuclease/exonuclease/phosphatase family protein n=1 Tax=Iamia majanohamensis TaxID=467976 RepID=A0AAE9Y3J5_9ACTN|nr:endonuclease/exonuclease/phosphatase family protein [Iamia majanohamensis]WCO65374.1 endonuclease/exonuclease/phosphatase family protein [Iamia majanohamensis]
MTAEGRVMTFNVGRGASGPQGTGPDDLGRVAEVLADGGGVDVACLQEVHGPDVPALAAALRADHGIDVHAHFTATVPADRMARSLRVAEQRSDDRRVAHLRGRQSDYGIAVLSRQPLTTAVDHRLPDDGREDRAAQVVTTALDGAPLTVVATHLGLVTEQGLLASLVGRPTPQQAQTRAFLALAAGVDGPVVAAGDLNQAPATVLAAAEGTGLEVVSDTRRPTCGHRTIDYVLTGHGVRAGDPEVRAVPVSDHDPVVVAVEVPRPG